VSLRVIAVVCALFCAGRAGASCVGDCDGDGAVSIADLITGVAQSLAPGAPLTCAAFDRNADEMVTIDELIAAVSSALNGCPPEAIAFTAALDPDGPALLITPAAALRGGAVYAVVLTGGIADDAGRPLQPSAAFKVLKVADEPVVEGPIALYEDDPDAAANPYPDARLVTDGGVRIPDRFALRGLPDTPELATARGVARDIADTIGAAGFFSTTAPIRIALSSPVDLRTVTPDTVRFFARRDAQLDLAPLLDDLERAGVPSGTVALAISFPTQTIEDDLLAIRARLDDRLSGGSLRVLLTDPDPDDDLVIGVFQRGAPQFAAFFAANPEVATIVHGLLPSPDFRGVGGIFDPHKVSGAEAAADALLDFYLTLPATAGPHPVVILQHGFAGDNSFGQTIADELAHDGFAGIAISAVSHGRRGNFLDLLSSTPLQVRDIFRQTNADQMALVRGIQAGVDVDADGEPDIDPNRIGYLGVSLGGILGGTFIAVEPAVQMAVLNVAGGRVAFLGDNPGTRPFYSQYYAMLAELAVNSPEFETFRQRLLELGQQALDPADPLDYARRWSTEPFAGFTPRRVLIQEGIGDQLVDNASTEALAAAGGLAANQAMSDPGGVSGLWRFDPPGGHGIFGREDVRRQALRFLSSGGTEIIEP
jgi:dienelactone hydrolase